MGPTGPAGPGETGEASGAEGAGRGWGPGGSLEVGGKGASVLRPRRSPLTSQGPETLLSPPEAATASQKPPLPSGDRAPTPASAGSAPSFF